MTIEVGTTIRLDGAVRNPDREGAVAHLDLDRGFALAARAAMSGIDVIDPAVWVREKLAMALAGAVDEPPLRALLAALRSIHGEIMKRPERDRSWIAVGALLFHGDDGVAIAAGDTPCLRYRDGLLASLGRASDELPAGAPRGSLGSETQVRIEVVPLRPLPGDVYILASRPLREGELAILARSLEASRAPGALLRTALEGGFDTGRLVIRVLAPGESRTGADPLGPPEAPPVAIETAAPPIEIESIAPKASFTPPEAPIVPPASEVAPDVAEATYAPYVPPSRPDEYDSRLDDRTERERFDEHEDRDEPGFARSVDDAPSIAAGLPPVLDEPAPVDAYEGHHAAEAVESQAEPMEAARSDAAISDAPPPDTNAPPSDGPSAEPDARRLRPRPSLATVGEERPWYEPLALWGGGALAIIALALLVKAILPGIVPSNGRGGSDRVEERASGTSPRAPIASAAHGATLEILSEPPGAVVRLNGEPLPGRTPLTDIAVDPGIHRVELDWGAGGSWRDTIDVAAGAKLTLHPAIYGSLAFRASEAGRVLDVYVDGAYAGTTPLALDRVTVGRHLIRFGGPGITMTAQEVDVLRDVHVELVGNAGALPATGKLTIKTAILGDEGFQSGKSDPIWVDGVVRGATPLTVTLPPGMHSVRVVRRDFPAQVTVIDVKPGNEHFVTAEFGARSGEPLRFTPPDALSRSAPTPLTVSVPVDAGDDESSVWLYAAAPGGSFQARAMTRLADDARTYAALVPDEVLRNSMNQIRVYFKHTATGGHEAFSEIVTIPVHE